MSNADWPDYGAWGGSAAQGARTNEPGQHQLRLRVGRHDDFLLRLQEELATKLAEHARVEGTQHVYIEASRGFASGVLHAWATVMDILTFYQERIANEGYLRTAREARSLRALAEEVAYRIRPAVSARTTLVFKPADVPRAPAAVVVPRDTPVLSVPGPGEVSVTFETTRPVEIRRAWSAMRPVVQHDRIPRAPRTAGRAELSGIVPLRTGAGLLVVNDAAWHFAQIVDVTTNADTSTTSVQWSPPEPETLADAALHTFDLTTRMFGHGAPPFMQNAAAPEDRYGGMFRGTEAGWGVTIEGLPPRVRRVAGDDRQAFCIAPEFGAFVSVDGGATWSPANLGLTRRDVTAVAVCSGTAYIGTAEGGLFRSADVGGTWELISAVGYQVRRRFSVWTTEPTGLPASVVRAIVAHTPDDDELLFVGTDVGVYTTVDAGRTWTAMNRGLPDVAKNGSAPVSFRAFTGRSFTLYGATDRGLFELDGKKWKAAADPKVSVPMNAVVLLGTRLVVATADGNVLVEESPGGGWKASETIAGVHTLATIGDTIYAASANGLYTSSDGTQWTAVADALLSRPPSEPNAGSPLPITALGAAGTTVLAFSPVTTKAIEDWPVLTAPLTTLDLDTEVPPPRPGSTIVVVTPDEGDEAQAARPVIATQARLVDRPNPGSDVSRRITRVIVDAPEALQHVDRRRATVYLHSRRLPELRPPIHETTPLFVEWLEGKALPNQLELLDAPPPWPDDRRVAIMGKAPRLRVKKDGLVIRLRGDKERPLAPTESVILLARPTRSTWPVRTDDQREGVLEGLAVEDIVLVPARPKDPTIAELLPVDPPSTAQGRTHLRLGATPTLAYDGDTVSLSANTVEATHGAFVRDEILGSGDASLAGQRFTLSRKDVVYAQAGGVTRSSLIVRIHGVRWREVEDFVDAAPYDRSYVVRTDETGITTVAFGDGVRGARLPTGVDNVTATYRVGTGAVGNVRAGALTGLTSPPAFVDGVTNPVAASGGADRETDAQARRRAPLRLQTVGRVIALDDFAQLVELYPGVAKASLAWWRRPGVAERLADRATARALLVTVALEGGGRPSPESALVRDMLETLERTRIAGALIVPLVHIAAYRPKPFGVRACLRIDALPSEEEAVKKTVLAHALDALRTAFRFETRELGGPVESSAVTRVLQAVPRVVAVDRRPELFDVADGEPRDRLVCALPEWVGAGDGEASRFVADELLVLDDAYVDLEVHR